ncbi:MAG: porphobilinogen synthase [Clostridia bacterium]|nr:porphobilinogen synthase [Clostridia bacterium]
MSFPALRMRRLRRTAAIRDMVAEVKLSASDLVYPLFVREGRQIRNEVESMPGIYQLSPDCLLPVVEQVVKAGIRAVLFFGIPAVKDERGSGAYDEEGIVQRTVRMVKREFPDLVVITDVCLCEYTSHGHCGLVEAGQVLNDPSLELLARTAVSHARAGADIVAPSDMMDGRVGAIRKALDQEGYADTAIMAYSAKYASAFYGPFREAAGSAPQFGDRSSYQMDPRASITQAIQEGELDIAEGADIVMVKPALAYLDVVARFKEKFLCPVAAYNVSGEYAMVKAAAARGWLDERRVVMELMYGLKRAGCDLIITYHAPEVARWLKDI